LKMHTTGVPEDTLSLRAYEALITPNQMLKAGTESGVKAKL